MKEVTRKNYICDFCGKYYVRKHAAEWHEKHCRLNPANDHKCFQDCKHLHQERDLGEITITCRKKNCTMYGYAAERRRLLDAIENSDIRMPIECDDFEDMTFDDIFHKNEREKIKPARFPY